MSAHYVEHNGIIAMLQPASVLCTNANSRTMTLTLVVARRRLDNLWRCRRQSHQLRWLIGIRTDDDSFARTYIRDFLGQSVFDLSTNSASMVRPEIVFT